MDSFSNPISKIIRSRTSIRTYSDQPLAESKSSELTNFIASLKAGPFGNTARFFLLTPGEANNQKRKLGTYGFIRGTTNFIVGTLEKERLNLPGLVDFGYLFENIVLFATDRDLGTCWLGATYSTKDILTNLSLEDGNVIPAVVAVGHKMDKRGIVDSIVRWAAKSHTRKSWELLFFENSFDNPLDPKQMDSDPFGEVLEMVRLAPSASNKQPWRIVKAGKKNIFHFFIQRTNGYDKMLRYMNIPDLQAIDLGIAMAHFDNMARDLRIKGNWKLLEHGIDGLPEKCSYVISWIQI